MLDIERSAFIMDNMSSNTAVALSEIRAGLARHSLTQEQLAAKLEVSRTAVGNRLKGKVPFTVDELTITAEFIRVPMVDLLSSSPSYVSTEVHS